MKRHDFVTASQPIIIIYVVGRASLVLEIETNKLTNDWNWYPNQKKNIVK